MDRFISSWRDRFFLIIIFALITGCRSSGLLPSQQARNIVIDGSAQEWPTLTKVKSNEKVSYGVYNDDESVYFLLKSHNRKWIDDVSRSGFTLWVDGNGARSKDLGIIYMPPTKNGLNFRDPGSNPVNKKNGRRRRAALGTIAGVQENGVYYDISEVSDVTMNAGITTNKERTFFILEAEFSRHLVNAFARDKNIDKGKLAFLMEIGLKTIRQRNFTQNATNLRDERMSRSMINGVNSTSVARANRSVFNNPQMGSFSHLNRFYPDNQSFYYIRSMYLNP
ncbi:MAG: hypothetical protein JXQ96_16850 [Cyclobacteriaceae bacterium]